MTRRNSIAFAAAVLAAAGATAAEAQSGALCGLHRGFVADIRDPEGRDRLEIAIPATGAARMWAERVYAKKPFRAAAANVGDQVFVQFEACDPARPIVIGFARPL